MFIYLLLYCSEVLTLTFSRRETFCPKKAQTGKFRADANPNLKFPRAETIMDIMKKNSPQFYV